jgi:hypothetical protein
VLTSPTFHHLHLNSLDPDAAIDFYTEHFRTTSRTMWGGFAALESPNGVRMRTPVLLCGQPTHRLSEWASGALCAGTVSGSPSVLGVDWSMACFFGGAAGVPAE